MSRKSPAFQFYPDNFVSGAPAFMEPLETHVYIWLLCLDWNRSGFALNDRELAGWCRVSVGQFRKAWPKVSECFSERDGRFYNPRLDAEREKQREYAERMAENGRKGGRPKADVKPDESRGFPEQKPELSETKADGKPNESIPIPSPIPRTTTTQNLPADAGDSTDVASPATPRPAFSLAPYLDAHRERFPDSDPPAKRYGAVFKRLEGKHGAEETLRRWRICLTRKGTFATPEELSAHWSEYAVEAIRAGPAIDPNLPLVDEWGQLTEYGERVTRPDRLKANPYA